MRLDRELLGKWKLPASNMYAGNFEMRRRVTHRTRDLRCRWPQLDVDVMQREPELHGSGQLPGASVYPEQPVLRRNQHSPELFRRWLELHGNFL